MYLESSHFFHCFSVRQVCVDPLWWVMAGLQELLTMGAVQTVHLPVLAG